MNGTIVVKEILGDFILERTEAQRLLRRVESVPVVLDFVGVRTLSPSFLNELLSYEKNIGDFLFINLSPVKMDMLKAEREYLASLYRRGAKPNEL